jgi:selenocysteine-specific elongation factor
MGVDRAFSVPGFGTVVTGTLTSGALAVEDHLELLPRRAAVRVRGLQVHGRPVERAAAGHRVAVNLGGIARADVRRGDVLATPESLEPATLLAVRLQALPAAPAPLRSGQRLHLHLGTAEALCRATLLEGDELAPGASGFALLRLEAPLGAGRGDRFIVRSYSPVRTVGGGTVLEVGRRFRRRRAEDLEALALAERGDPAEHLLLAFADGRPRGLGAAASQAGLPPAEAGPLAAALRASGRLIGLGGDGALLITPRGWEGLCGAVEAALAAYHERYPLRTGMPREELRGAALGGVDPRAAAVVLAAMGAGGGIRAEGDRVALQGHRPQLPGEVAPAAALLVEGLRDAGLQPPPVATALAAAGLPGGEAAQAELLAFLVSDGRLVRSEPGLYFAAEPLAAAAARVRAHLQTHGSATLAEIRDLLGVTRKHAVPVAEYLDSIHVTRRDGDVRRLA